MNNIYKDAELKILNILNESDNSNNLQDIIDLLYQIFNKYNWIGVYLIKDNYLILGPWRGKQSTEHKKIPIGEGICGSAAKTGMIELINNVKKDNRYLACFISTKSEIVVPIKRNDIVIGEIDIDSDKKDAFNDKDCKFLETLATNRTFINLCAKYYNTLNL
jgi:GAF domain-containing protein